MGDAFVEKEEGSGKRLGVMGLVRKHQPQMIVNERFRWFGDVHGEEGSAATSGDIRAERYMGKCMSVQKPSCRSPSPRMSMRVEFFHL